MTSVSGIEPQTSHSQVQRLTTEPSTLLFIIVYIDTPNVLQNIGLWIQFIKLGAM
jgi:hypothetical protein